MPTYDYICEACGAALEIFQSMKESAKKKCPECGKMALERLIGTGAAVMFKGSGFYETDYRSDSYKKSAEADKKASETKPETKSESKSESKADSKAGKKFESKTAPKTKAESKK